MLILNLFVMLLQDKSAVDMHKGHEFVPIHYRTPTTCDSCNKPVWHMLHPPQALECRREYPFRLDRRFTTALY